MAMLTINRAGKRLGPYSLEDVQRYLAEGRLALNEPACLNGSQNWEPLQGLLKKLEQPPRPGPQPYVPPNATRTQGPAPPSLHWLAVLLLYVVSSGVFGYIWLFVQASFAKKLDPKSKATAYLAFAVGCVVVYVVAYLGLKPQLDSGYSLSDEQGVALLVAFACVVGAVVLSLMGIFSIRSSLQRYYRDVEPLGTTFNGEPIGLRLSSVLTFFFNALYLQYHLSRIAKWKETGGLD